MLKSVCELVRDAESNFIHGTSKLGEYVDFDMHDTIEVIDAYLNSKHISGATDSLGREKPFFNICTAAANIWYRATDIDRKNIRILPQSTDHTAHAFIASVILQEWMRRERFGTFLNQWGLTLARYGSAVVKFVEKDGRLIPSVVPWNRFIADPVQFDAIPRIEKFYMTPEQLRKMDSYDQEMVSRLIDTAQSTRKNLDGMQKDNKAGFIEIYEVHGEMDSRLLEDDPDEQAEPKYRQQMHVVSFVESKTSEYDEYTLYKGKESKDPYMITHLIEEDGRTLAKGAVEQLFDAQWMVNHSMKNVKDTLDLASKLIFQTADSKFLGRNVLSAIETGDIFVHKQDMPLTRLANDKPDIQAFMNYKMAWEQLGQGITATPDAMRGDTPPSGTPYSTTALITQQSNSLFEQMTEAKGLHLEDMMREYIIPYIKKKMDTKDEVVAILDAAQIAELDAMYVPKAAVRNYNERFIQQLEASLQSDQQPLPQPFDPAMEEQAVQKSMAAQGNRRSFKPDELDMKTWKEALKDLEWNVIVEVTNENTDKQAVLTTLSAVLQTIAANPMMLNDPNAKMILGAILTETGRISPLQLSAVAAQTAPTPAPATAALQDLAAKTQ